MIFLQHFTHPMNPVSPVKKLSVLASLRLNVVYNLIGRLSRMD